jgi:hypothetical protein
MGEVLFAHVYGLMNAIPAPLPAALVDRGKLRVLHRARPRQTGAGANTSIAPRLTKAAGAFRAQLFECRRVSARRSFIGDYFLKTADTSSATLPAARAQTPRH